jgi:alkaline phosphatase
MKYLLAVILCFPGAAYSQETSSIIFSHNDYLQEKPFETAYNLSVGFVEADVFLRDDNLMVAHTAIEIGKERTLDKLYLDPIRNKIQNNSGTIYPDATRKLTLMIDLKTEGIPTLNAIVEHLKNYPEIISCKRLTIAISGNVPDTSQWKTFPTYISFDGRPNKIYSPKHLQRVSFISNSFSTYSTWNGKGKIPNADLKKITEVVASVHAQGKKIRFWGAPDVPNCWEVFLQLGIEILGTDKINELYTYLKTP